jgi:hypothetical protein
MGDRVVNIRDPNTSRKVIPNSDTLSGIFFPSFSDALGETFALEATVSAITLKAMLLTHPQPGQTSFVDQLRSTFSEVDSTVITLEHLIKVLHDEGPALMDSVNYLTGKAAEFTTAVAAAAPIYTNGLDKAIISLETVVDSLESGLSVLSQVVDTLSSPESFIWQDDVTRLKNSLLDTRKLIRDLVDGNQNLKLIISRLKKKSK